MQFVVDNAIKFQTGESTTIKQGSSPIPMQNSADVVFVVEQKHTCSDSMYTENLKVSYEDLFINSKKIFNLKFDINNHYLIISLYF